MAFEGKVILITGSASGIGAGAARHLAKLGGRIAMVDRDEKKLEEMANQIEADGSPKPLAISADITMDAKRIIDETINHFGQLNVLINNAGIVRMNNILTMKMSEFNEVFNVNLRSAIFLTQLAVPYLEKTKGNVVNVSSVCTHASAQNILSYCISKASLEQFTKCAALDLGSKGIRVNAIKPGMIQTPLFAKTIEDMDDAKKQIITRMVEEKYGHIGTVQDTANAIEFFASDKAAFITGHVHIVDGGATIA